MKSVNSVSLVKQRAKGKMQRWISQGANGSNSVRGELERAGRNHVHKKKQRNKRYEDADPEGESTNLICRGARRKESCWLGEVGRTRAWDSDLIYG